MAYVSGEQRSVLYVGSQDLVEWRAAHASGRRASTLPYGVDYLERLGFAIRSAPTAPLSPALAKIRDVVEHRTQIQVERQLRTVREVARADLVVAALEEHARLVSMLRAARVRPWSRVPLVALSCWWADRYSRAAPAQRRSLRRGIEGVDALVYWSETQTSTYVEMGFRRDRLVPVPYGIDAQFYAAPPETERDIPLLSVGGDSGRDYPTLLRAALGLQCQLSVVAPLDRFPAPIPSSIRPLGVVAQDEYRDLLQRSRIVVVPTHVRLYPTGQSVALEAAAAGACVVVTGTPAMREYFTDGETAVLVPPGDPDALRSAVERLAADDAERTAIAGAGQRLVSARFTTQRMWEAVTGRLTAMGLL